MMFDLSNLSEIIKQWRHDLHSIPEIGLHLPMTRAYICKELDKMGVEYTLHNNSSSAVAIIRGGCEGKTFAIRCDMDALPIKEETDIPFASTNGNMHACGHDAHTAIGLGVAKILTENKEHFTGCVKILFQAGEEGADGACYMIKDGALQNPNVDVIIALHVITNFPNLPIGAIGLKHNNILAGTRTFEIRAKGTGGHIANIASITNPIITLCKVAVGIDSIQKKAIENNQDLALSATVFHSGSQRNIIPTEAILEGSIRYYDELYADMISQKMGELCDENDCQLSWGTVLGAVVNDNKFTTQLVEIATTYDDIKMVVLKDKFMASDDIYHFFKQVRGSYIHLNCGFEDMAKNLPLHTPGLILNEDAFVNGALFMARCAADWLNQNSLISDHTAI